MIAVAESEILRLLICEQSTLTMKFGEECCLSPWKLQVKQRAEQGFKASVSKDASHVRPAEAAEAYDCYQANDLSTGLAEFLNRAVSFHSHSMLDAVMLVS